MPAKQMAAISNTMNAYPDPDTDIIKVKLLSKVNEKEWLRQLPDDLPVWKNCHFIFDQQATDYDWLIVYNDLPPNKGERFSNNVESLCCPKEHTLLITTEPSSIKTYGGGFTSQFGHILTSQEAWALPHPGRIYSQPALHWFYGLGKNHKIAFNTMRHKEPANKQKIISTVCSNKKQKHTLHNKRYQFTRDLKVLMPELDIYGHGVKNMDDKAESLDNYQYHIAIENHIGIHHWTEKLSDAFLGLTLPFYYGCPNAASYFPEQSFIPIDINDINASYRIITDAIKNNEYEKRLPYIRQARELVLNEYNLFAVLTREINRLHSKHVPATEYGIILSRRALRKRQPLTGLKDILEKGRNRIINRYKK